MFLDSVNKSIEILLQAASTTNHLPVVASFTDNTATALTAIASDTQTNGVTPVTIVAAPAASTQRQVKHLSIYNADTVAATITIRLNNNGTYRILKKIALGVGQSLAFDGNTWDAGNLTEIAPSGAVVDWPMPIAPTNWLLANGSAVSRTTYTTLFNLLIPSMGNFTVTIASPAVVTLNDHGRLTGDQVYLTTTGALPTGLAANTLYYIIKIDANTFNLATSRVNADAGTKINTSGTQSGVHTCMFCPYGLGDGSTTFNVPDLRGKGTVGFDSAQTEFNNLGETGGAKTHTLTITEMPAHTHTYLGANAALYGHPTYTVSLAGGPATNTSSTGSDGAHNNLQPYGVMNKIIKT